MTLTTYHDLAMSVLSTMDTPIQLGGLVAVDDWTFVSELTDYQGMFYNLPYSQLKGKITYSADYSEVTVEVAGNTMQLVPPETQAEIQGLATVFDAVRIDPDDGMVYVTFGPLSVVRESQKFFRAK